MNRSLNIDDLKRVYQILRSGGLHLTGKIDYSAIYVDRHYFFDYIIKVNNTWWNICLINELNHSRYKVLQLVNERIKNSSYYKPTTIKIIEEGINKWFVEIIEEFPTLNNKKIIHEIDYFGDGTITSPYNFLCEYKIKKLLSSIKIINEDIQSISLPAELAHEHYSFFRNIGYTSDKYGLANYNNSHPGDVMLSYCDIFCEFHLNRIKECDNRYIFTGIQSCVPYTIEKVKDILYEKYINE